MFPYSVSLQYDLTYLTKAVKIQYGYWLGNNAMEVMSPALILKTKTWHENLPDWTEISGLEPGTSYVFQVFSGNFKDFQEDNPAVMLVKTLSLDASNLILMCVLLKRLS